MHIKRRLAVDVIRGCFLWGTVILSAIITSTSVLMLFPLVYLFQKDRHILHACANIWGKTIKYLNPWWTFKIIGHENLAKKNQAVIYVANHQSQADILALLILSTRFRWLSKASLFKIPLFGWAMSAIGYVPILRGNRKSADHCMRISKKHLKNGIPIVFFPEGTRSKNGELGAFKNGAFHLAVTLNIPVVPITINGCAELLPKGSLLPKVANVTIHIHESISPENLSEIELMLKARNVIANQLNLLKTTQKKDLKHETF